MGGYLANRWVAAADFVLGVVGIFTLIFRGAASPRAFGAAALLLCPLMPVTGFFDWRRQMVLGAGARVGIDIRSHRKDLIDYALEMEGQIGRHVPRFFACPELGLF